MGILDATVNNCGLVTLSGRVTFVGSKEGLLLMLLPLSLRPEVGCCSTFFFLVRFGGLVGCAIFSVVGVDLGFRFFDAELGAV